MQFQPSPDDVEAVTSQLGRKPRADFRVVVRDDAGAPVVIMNAPRLHDGTPMPTLYWLTGPLQTKLIGHLESEGGVDRAEAEVDAAALLAAHERYAAERGALLAPSELPRPTGGVGGTRVGVKCLHAHYAYFLAGGQDPVGDWVARRLRERSHGH